MSPLRWDVICVAFVLALPVLALAMRGDLSTDEMIARLPWCLLGGYLSVALIRYASKPRGKAPATRAGRADATGDDEHFPTA
jgi:hypothetical protein